MCTASRRGIPVSITAVPPAGNATQGTTARRNLLKRKTTKTTLKATIKPWPEATDASGNTGVDVDSNLWWLAGYWQLDSPNGRFRAEFQYDGNLVIRDKRNPSPAKWRSNTEGRLADGRSQQNQNQDHKMIFYTPVRQRMHRV